MPKKARKRRGTPLDINVVFGEDEKGKEPAAPEPEVMPARVEMGIPLHEHTISKMMEMRRYSWTVTEGIDEIWRSIETNSKNKKDAQERLNALVSPYSAKKIYNHPGMRHYQGETLAEAAYVRTMAPQWQRKIDAMT